jgi:hypothetical protein
MTRAYSPISIRAEIVRDQFGIYRVNFHNPKEKDSITFENFNEVIQFLKNYEVIESPTFVQLIEKDIYELMKEIEKNRTWKTLGLRDNFCSRSTAYEFLDTLKKNPILKCHLPENPSTDSLEHWLFQNKEELNQKIIVAKKDELVPVQSAPSVQDSVNTNSPKEKPEPLVVKPVTGNVEVSKPFPSTAEEPAKTNPSKEKEIEPSVEKSVTANVEVSRLPTLITTDDIRRSVLIPIDIAFAVCSVLSPSAQQAFSETISDHLDHGVLKVPLSMVIAKTILASNCLDQVQNVFLRHAINSAPPARVVQREVLPDPRLVSDAPEQSGGTWASDDENAFSGDENLVVRGCRM